MIFFIWISDKLVDLKWISTKDEVKVNSVEIEELIDNKINSQDLLEKVTSNSKEMFDLNITDENLDQMTEIMNEKLTPKDKK